MGDSVECIDIVSTKCVPSNQSHKAGWKMMGSRETRDVTINIRAKQNQRDLIDQAAKIQGKSRSEFMLESSYQQATDVLLNQNLLRLDPAKFEQFLALLDAPPQPNEPLRRLLNHLAPWD